MLIGAIASELACLLACLLLAYLLTCSLLCAEEGSLDILLAGKFARSVVLRFGGVDKEALLATIVDIGVNVLARRATIVFLKET